MSRINYAFNNVGVGVAIYAYAVMLGAAYLLAFWRPFGFNVFSYLSLSDYVASSFSRLIIVLIAPLFGFLFLFRDSFWIKENFKYFSIAIILLHFYGSAVNLYDSFELYRKFEFSYSNELSLIIFSLILCIFSAFFFLFNVRKIEYYSFVTVIVFLQISSLLSIGYKDGKQIYNGADRVMYLDNIDLCEKNGVRDWVYLAHYSGKSFFMNTIEKRICILNDKEFVLRPRYSSYKAY